MLSYKLKRVKGRCYMRDTCGLCVRVISGGPYKLAYLFYGKARYGGAVCGCFLVANG